MRERFGKISFSWSESNFTIWFETYFWRTTGAYPKEIDFLEVLDGSIKAFACKLSNKIQASLHESFFKEKYPGSKISVDCTCIFKEGYTSSKDADNGLDAYLQALQSIPK